MDGELVKIYTPNGRYVGYFAEPEIRSYPEGGYEIQGQFYDDRGEPVGKIEYNPQALPFTAELAGIKDVKHTKLFNVYVQRGRDPICMSGFGL